MPPRDSFKTSSFSDAVRQMPSFIRDEERYNLLSSEQDDLFARSNERPRIGGPEATIAALISALPAVIGAAFLGDEGFAYGAESGAKGVGQTFDNLKALGDEEQKAALVKYTRNEKEMTDLRNNMQAIEQQARQQDYANAQTLQQQAFTHGEGVLNRMQQEELARMREAGDDRRAGAGARATLEAKKQEAVNAAMRAIASPARGEELKKDLQKTLGYSREELDEAFKDPHKVADLIAERYQEIPMASKEDWANIGAENLVERKRASKVREANQLASQIATLEKDFQGDKRFESVANKASIASEVINLLSQKDNRSADKLAQTAVTRIYEKGALSNRDVDRIVQDVFSGNVQDAMNWISGSASGTLTQDQKDALFDVTVSMQTEAAFQLDSLRSEARTTAKDRMPGASDEQVERVVGSLGKQTGEVLQGGASTGKTIDVDGVNTPVVKKPDGYYITYQGRPMKLKPESYSKYGLE